MTFMKEGFTVVHSCGVKMTDKCCLVSEQLNSATFCTQHPHFESGEVMFSVVLWSVLVQRRLWDQITFIELFNHFEQ